MKKKGKKKKGKKRGGGGGGRKRKKLKQIHKQKPNLILLLFRTRCWKRAMPSMRVNNWLTSIRHFRIPLFMFYFLYIFHILYIYIILYIIFILLLFDNDRFITFVSSEVTFVNSTNCVKAVSDPTYSTDPCCNTTYVHPLLKILLCILFIFFVFVSLQFYYCCAPTNKTTTVQVGTRFFLSPPPHSLVFCWLFF
jgi:hypothetical protein